MPRAQFRNHIREFDAARTQQNEQVENQIGRLAAQIVRFLRHRRQRRLDALFTDLLRDDFSDSPSQMNRRAAR